MANRKKKRISPESVRRDVTQRLRSILRQIEELRESIASFVLVNQRPIDAPRLLVRFSDHEKPADIQGLRRGMKELILPDERIQDDAWQLAESIWHLGDALAQWAELTGGSLRPKDLAKGSQSLRLCSDLANRRKHGHGRHDNLSGRNPAIGLVHFDTSQSGEIELFYNGATKEKVVYTTQNNPIPFKVHIDLDTGMIDDACAVFDDAIREWMNIIHQMGILAQGDAESVAVRDRLAAIAKIAPPTIREIPPYPNYEPPA